MCPPQARPACSPRATRLSTTPLQARLQSLRPRRIVAHSDRTHLTVTLGHYNRPLHPIDTNERYKRPLQMTMTPDYHKCPLHRTVTPDRYASPLRLTVTSDRYASPLRLTVTPGRCRPTRFSSRSSPSSVTSSSPRSSTPTECHVASSRSGRGRDSSGCYSCPCNGRGLPTSRPLSRSV